MAIFLKRDTKVYLRKIAANTTVIWEIPVLDGFSFSQGNTTSEVTLNEMATSSGYSKRGRRMFNDALAPAEWSFSTYIRPFVSTVAYASNGAGGSNNRHAVEEALWANFVGNGGWTTVSTGILSLSPSPIVVVGGTNGAVYEIDQGEYTTNGSGFGATFRITLTSTTSATVEVINPGTGYQVGDTIVIAASSIGVSSITSSITVGALTSSEDATYDGELENTKRNTTNLRIYSTGSGVAELGTFDLFFVMGATNNGGSLNYTASASPTNPIEIYKLANCCINEATINFDVEGIAMIDWSGMATLLTTQPDFNASAAITEGISSTTNFIRNKLTALSCVAANTTIFPGANNTGAYNIILTGGSITLSNNITYLTPETLGIVNTPIGHITGNKSVSGNFTAYVDTGSTNGSDGSSGDLFDNMTSSTALAVVTNSFNLTFSLGGTSGTPRFVLNLPTAHLEIPTVQSEDVISLDVAFHGLPSKIDANDEFNITYVA